ncbi:DEAD/DEAH box helicase family protein [Candidatus Uhrbacteria bacterium]|nr:DEAD/DEAH box helicase family protein [Candidatus Uhrbacteria bacterium]
MTSLHARFQLDSPYTPAGDQPQAIEKLARGLANGVRYQTLLGVTGSGKTFTMANVIAAYGKPVLVVAPNKTLAAQLYQEYKSFFPKSAVCYFVSYYDYYQPEAYIPTTDTYIEKEAMINEDIDRFRHVATTALLTRRDVIIVASVSCIYNLGVPENYFSASIKLGLGKPITRGDLAKQLVKIGFERNDSSPKRGSFRLRGDTFEIAAASEETLYRIELRDQVISSMSIIDATTRHEREHLTEIVIFPPKHFVTTVPERERAIIDIRDELHERLTYLTKKGLLLEAERLERRTRHDIEMLKTLGFCHGIENYSRHLSGKLPGDPPDSLLSYFPRTADGKPDFLTIIDESHIAVPQIIGMYAGDQARKKVLVEFGWRLPSALDNRPHSFGEFTARTGATIFTSATPGKFELDNSPQVVEQIVRPTGLVDPPIEIRPVYAKPRSYSHDAGSQSRHSESHSRHSESHFRHSESHFRHSERSEESRGRSQIDDVIEEAALVEQKGGRTLLITLTKKMAEELTVFLVEKGLRAKFMHADTKTIERTEILRDFRKNEFNILVGINLLREGLDLPEVQLVAILDADREGFLRSEVSLIQTMGRAARNIEGRVILYADVITGSMRRAMDECGRRRTLQLAYNKEHNITPRSTVRKVQEME